jgi:hypothetical protein
MQIPRIGNLDAPFALNRLENEVGVKPATSYASWHWPGACLYESDDLIEWF